MITMNKEDRDEVRIMLNDVLGKPIAEINGKLNVVQNDITYIKGQTTLTNSRVTKLEQKVEEVKETEANHVINCPNKDIIHSNFNRIVDLEKSDVGRKVGWQTITKFIVISSAVIGTAAGIIFSLIHIFYKQ